MWGNLSFESLHQLAEKRPEYPVELGSRQRVVGRLVVNLVQHNQEISKRQQRLVRRPIGRGDLTSEPIGQRLDADQTPQPPFERLGTPDWSLEVRSELSQNARSSTDAV
jgi:hypothetical protein